MNVRRRCERAQKSYLRADCKLMEVTVPQSRSKAMTRITIAVGIYDLERKLTLASVFSCAERQVSGIDLDS